MPRKSAIRPSSHARSEAAEWFVALRECDGDETTRRDFYTWLRNSPENIHAFLRMTALWEDTGLLKDAPFDVQTLVQRAAQSTNVFELDPSSAPPPVKHARLTRLRLGLSMAASILLLICAITWLQLHRDIYVTETGEQRTLALPDGTSIVLNARSRLRVRFSSHGRDVDLLEGQAIFRVAHSPVRPFIVHIGPTQVRAVGTQFDVHRRERGTVVTVLEGAVAVSGGATLSEDHQQQLTASAAESSDRLVTAGQQLEVSTTIVGAPHPVDVSVATAWSQGKLIFHETPLTEVVAEFNRYSSRRLIVEDEQLRQFHVSGVFPSSDPSRVAELLHQRFGATVQQNDDEIRVSR